MKGEHNKAFSVSCDEVMKLNFEQASWENDEDRRQVFDSIFKDETSLSSLYKQYFVTEQFYQQVRLLDLLVYRNQRSLSAACLGQINELLATGDMKKLLSFAKQALDFWHNKKESKDFHVFIIQSIKLCHKMKAPKIAAQLAEEYLHLIEFSTDQVSSIREVVAMICQHENNHQFLVDLLKQCLLRDKKDCLCRFINAIIPDLIRFDEDEYRLRSQFRAEVLAVAKAVDDELDSQGALSSEGGWGSYIDSIFYQGFFISSPAFSEGEACYPYRHVAAVQLSQANSSMFSIHRFPVADVGLSKQDNTKDSVGSLELSVPVHSEDWRTGEDENRPKKSARSKSPDV